MRFCQRTSCLSWWSRDLQQQMALSCTHLRKLCQNSTHHLELPRKLQQDNPLHEAPLARQLVTAFPNCTSLYFAWGNSSMVGTYSGIHPLLAG